MALYGQGNICIVLPVFAVLYLQTYALWLAIDRTLLTEWFL